MKNKKKAGIWMDHSNAIIMELVSDSIFEQNLMADTKVEEETSLNKSEKMRQNKEQHQLTSYYKKLTEIMRNFDEILLFGPTSAKDELLNILNENHLFDAIKIEIKKTDKMTEIEMHKLVKEYFK